MSDEHLDHALAEEFAGKGETIHQLKTGNPHFRNLMVHNHELWTEIQNIQTGVAPAEDAALHELEKKRLKVLDEIGAMIRAAEA
jgi:hypothetical protein